MFDAVRQPLVVDDDQQVIIELIAFGCVRLTDPAAPRVATVQNDLLDPPLTLPLLRR
jgi:hypothetical protein